MNIPALAPVDLTECVTLSLLIQLTPIPGRRVVAEGTNDPFVMWNTFAVTSFVTAGCTVVSAIVTLDTSAVVGGCVTLATIVISAVGATVVISVVVSVVITVAAAVVSTVVGAVVAGAEAGVWVHPVARTSTITRISNPKYFFMERIYSRPVIKYIESDATCFSVRSNIIGNFYRNGVFRASSS